MDGSLFVTMHKSLRNIRFLNLLWRSESSFIQEPCVREVVNLMPNVMYLLVGVLSLVMAYKCLFSNKLIPFHEKAAGMSWDRIDSSLQAVLLALMRVSGLGFLVVAMLLLFYPVLTGQAPNALLKYTIPLICVLFCTGLFWANYLLHQKTKSPTPWKDALAAVLMLLAGMIISSL